MKNYLSNNRVADKLEKIYKEVKDSIKYIKKFFRDNLVNSDKGEENEFCVELETDEIQSVTDIKEKKDKFYGFINKVTDIENELKNNINIFVSDIIKKEKLSEEITQQDFKVQVDSNLPSLTFEEAISAFIKKRIEMEDKNNKGTLSFTDSLISLANENKKLYDSLSRTKNELDEFKYYNDKYQLSDNIY